MRTAEFKAPIQERGAASATGPSTMAPVSRSNPTSEVRGWAEPSSESSSAPASLLAAGGGEGEGEAAAANTTVRTGRGPPLVVLAK